MMSILIIAVCILLILVILIQNSKGGGIQSQFGAATQIMGVKRGTEVVEKATWALAIVMIILSVIMAPKIGEVKVGTSKTKGKAAGAINMQQPAPLQQQMPAGPPPPAGKQ